MKRTAAEYSRLLALLDEVLDLPEESRAAWVDELPEADADIAPTLRRMLARTAHETTEIDELQGRIAVAVLEAAARPDAACLRSGDLIGPYELVREIGRGGMGFVWLAKRADGAFKRSVALKLPYAAWTGRLAERMSRERDILAGLEHPNIARFYDAGIDTLGRPFMAMEYVEGQAIDVYCRERQLSLRDQLGLVLKVAKAVAFAHSKLVVHRDLKPANMMVTGEGEVRLLDFGIAKLIEGDSGGAPETQFAGRLLTPHYASPEQIRGAAIGTATDVYSLAVVTYELLTGTRPYRLKRQNAAELAEAIAETDPPNASAVAHDAVLRRQLRGDLDSILNKAMKKNPSDRYGSVEAFSNDLQRYLNGEAVLARPDGAAYRLRKLAGRHRLALSAACVIVLALSAATSVSLMQAGEAKRQAARATATKEFLLRVFRANDPRIATDKPRSEITARELLDVSASRIEKEFAGQPDLQIELLGLTADMYDTMSEEKQYAAAQKRRIELARAYYGANDPIVIQGLLSEADGACQRQDYNKVQRLLDETDVALRSSGQDHGLLRANWLRTRARMLSSMGGRQEESRHTLDQALALYEEVAPRSNDYAAALSLASLDQTERGDNRQAARFLVRALEVAQAAPGRDDSMIADFLYNLARNQERLGEFSAAEATYARAEKQARETYGVRNAVYWIALAYHARLLHQRGQRERADALFANMLAVIPKDWSTNGNDKWARETYAECLTAEGRAREAIPLLEESQQYFLSHFRSDFTVREVRRKLADAYDQVGRTAEAGTLLQAARDESIAKDAPASPWVMRMRERRARFLLDHSQPRDPDFAAADAELHVVLEKAGDRPLLEVALAHSDLSRIAAARRDTLLALRESNEALAALARVQGIYDVRVQPQLWLVHSAQLLRSGDAAAAGEWAAKALQASIAYDAPASRAIADAQSAARLADAASIEYALGTASARRIRDMSTGNNERMP
ncbi:MAG: protein kinase [Gammaproteobacteria bacterium]